MIHLHFLEIHTTSEIEKVNDELFFFPIYIDGKGLRETFKMGRI